MTTPTANISHTDSLHVQRVTGWIIPVTVATDVSTTTNASFSSSVLTLTLGFAPKHILLINTTSGSQQEWFEGMTSTQCIETITNGSPSLETDVFTVTVGDAAGGSNGGGGTADSTPAGIITVAADILIIAAQTTIWIVEG